MTHQESDVSRRAILRGAAVGGVAFPLLAACGFEAAANDDNESGTSGSPSTGFSGGWVIGSTADVPVGGGTILADAEIVLTQATEGEFKAFSGACPHMGCLVTSVDNGTIKCPCHGSAFSIKDGSVVAGPAPAPLTEMKIAIDGDSISIR